jgi:hypothetical protein
MTLGQWTVQAASVIYNIGPLKVKRFGLVYPMAGMAGKNKKLADVVKAQVSPTKLTRTDLESNTGLHGEKWRLATCTTARPVVAVTC